MELKLNVSSKTILLKLPKARVCVNDFMLIKEQIVINKKLFMIYSCLYKCNNDIGTKNT